MKRITFQGWKKKLKLSAVKTALKQVSLVFEQNSTLQESKTEWIRARLKTITNIAASIASQNVRLNSAVLK